MKKTITLAGGIAALALASGSAAAQNQLLTFGYTDLDASYTSNGNGTGTFIARADDETTGDVTQYRNGIETAVFGDDFIDHGDADAVFELNISNITSNGASATGSFTLTDFDGDQITGTINGNWERVTTPGGFTAFAFTGVLTNIEYLANADGIFEGWIPGTGTDNNSFAFADISDWDPEGALVSIGLGPGTWFFEDFFNQNIQVSATVAQIPNPAAALLAGVPGLALVSRRRRD